MHDDCKAMCDEFVADLNLDRFARTAAITGYLGEDVRQQQ